MKHVNLADPSFEYDPEDPSGYHAGMFRFGPLLGAQETGASLYELPAGQALCPYHYEWSEEEWLLVVAGEVVVRHVGGETVLRPWDVTCFVTGPDGAHQVRNDSGETARVLMWSTVTYPAVTVYPDSDKIGVYTRGRIDDVMVERSGGVGYYHGESREG